MPSPRIVLAVTGGIAAYKAAEIIRGLTRAGASVTVVMTAGACRFITPLTLQTLSGRRVVTDQFDLAIDDPADVEHIGLARDCDLLLVAPATANFLAKAACGIADDFLGAFLLAVTCPVLIAPAMNTRMWEHPAVQGNLETLRRRGALMVDPESGPLASRREGEGMGRLADPARIVETALRVAAQEDAGRFAAPAPGGLRQKRVLVTAGPTREALDAVRFLTNPSTGRMGFAVAEAARDLGGRVTLISGPTHLVDPPGMDVVRVESAEQMHRAVMARVTDSDVVIKAAAVSDFRPVQPVPGKVRKKGAPLSIELAHTPDILAEIGAAKGARFLVGFAAETDDAIGHARQKLKAKHLDLIVANDLTLEGAGFGGDTNVVTVLDANGTEQRWPRMTKREVARRLMALVAERIS